MPVLANTSASGGPTSRPQAPNGVRPRPMSMPLSPQNYAPTVPTESATTTGASAQASVDSAATNGAGTSSRSQKPRQTSRVLGDYTLGKTLGQGSMGKVKLAYHNITGEKVRCVAFCALALPYPDEFGLYSLRSRYFLE